jgi:hypothetical protein
MIFEKIHWDAVIEGATAGIIAAIFLAPWPVLRDIIRNCYLKHSLRRQLRNISCGHGINGLTTQVPNFIGKEFTVRRVALIAAQIECPFYATGEVASCLKPTKSKPTREQKERLKRGEAIPVSRPRVELAKWRVAPTQAGFVTVAPFTSQEFLLPAELFVVALDANPICLSFTVEYQSWTQKSTLIEQRTDGNAVKMLKKAFEHYRSELLSGNLNNLRVKFALPEIKIPPAKPNNIKNE